MIWLYGKKSVSFPTNREATNAHLYLSYVGTSSVNRIKKIVRKNPLVENLLPLILYPDANNVKSALILL